MFNGAYILISYLEPSQLEVHRYCGLTPCMQRLTDNQNQTFLKYFDKFASFFIVTLP